MRPCMDAIMSLRIGTRKLNTGWIRWRIEPRRVHKDSGLRLDAFLLPSIQTLFIHFISTFMRLALLFCLSFNRFKMEFKCVFVNYFLYLLYSQHLPFRSYLLIMLSRQLTQTLRLLLFLWKQEKSISIPQVHIFLPAQLKVLALKKHKLWWLPWGLWWLS